MAGNSKEFVTFEFATVRHQHHGELTVRASHVEAVHNRGQDLTLLVLASGVTFIVNESCPDVLKKLSFA